MASTNRNRTYDANETRYWLPFFLEDKTGRLGGSEFTDLHDRMYLIYECSKFDSRGSTFEVYDATSRSSYSSLHVPTITLTFNADRSLGTVVIAKNEATRKDIGEWLKEVGDEGGSKHRKFTASDGDEYIWEHQTDDNEWTCKNINGDLIASYNLKIPGEPPYRSSGCMLTVEEDYGDLACEMLATCMVMRHIVHYEL